MPARISAIAVMLAAALCVGTDAVARGAPDPAPPSPTPSPRPIVLGGHYVAEFAGNTSGGLALGTAYASEFMLSGKFDLARLVGPGLGTVRLILTAREGSSLSANDVGNIFTVQEIYGDGLTPRLTELSYDQPFARGNADLYAGRINTENDFAASSAYWGGISLYCSYQNNAICGTPIAAPIDSGYVAYPSSAWGARFKAYPAPWFYLEAGAYEVNPESGLRGNGFKLSTTGDTGTFLPLEIGLTRKDALGNLTGSVKAGAYYDTSLAPTAASQLTRFLQPDSDALAYVPNETYRGRFGFWLLFDTLVAGSAAKDRRGIALFGALEYGDPQTSQLSLFADAGAIAHGTFAGRDDDTVSLGFAYTDINPRLRALETSLQNSGLSVPLTEQEKMLEFNYGARVAPWFALRPGVQYVINPSGEKTIPNALVWTLQGVASF
ncbi:MAG: carbohydrate porin [Candidatus Tumulicola sp.]